MAAEATISDPGPNFSTQVTGHSLWVEVFGQTESRLLPRFYFLFCFSEVKGETAEIWGSEPRAWPF